MPPSLHRSSHLDLPSFACQLAHPARTTMGGCVSRSPDLSTTSARPLTPTHGARSKRCKAQSPDKVKRVDPVYYYSHCLVCARRGGDRDARTSPRLSAAYRKEERLWAGLWLGGSLA